ncbi:hypothetical protein ETH_00006875 [Eimeria tenella]|uniref:Ankyrin repeat-containing protein n=1 Tax=Eimeria tenella TaxID=5802 RepID=U6L4A2_EIMTE|nr:hypothetical protein ETH_00006875 [Eimeria tenella]CDJ42605.1 hypothetical protein ETH_00006875 [Eimeria tenella]|eukprot:XP_013233355.1 hypothetical protein ETH_00006875 [Eimeria tenella]
MRAIVSGLLHAAFQVPEDWVQAMLERGANKSINDEDNEGRTALDRCEKGSPLYLLLLKYGAKPRPEKLPTPPPEPEVTVAASNPPASTDSEATKQTPEIVMADDVPGLEQHPGFWGSMCGCGGRTHKTEAVPVFKA